jgi:hypothetical protein
MRVASLRLRLLAALVDAAVVTGGFAALVGLGIGGAVAYARVRGDKDEQEGGDKDEQGGGEQDEQEGGDKNDQERGEQGGQDGGEQEKPSDIHRTTRKFRQSHELRAALWGASAGLAVASRNWRGPGFRVVRLRRVDARTGGIVSVRSALMGVWFDYARQAATRPIFESRSQRRRDRLRALGQQLRAVEREYADDPQARKRTVMEFYKANDVSRFAGCGWLVAGSVVSQLVLALPSRGGRTLRDRMTDTSVIVDR